MKWKLYPNNLKNWYLGRVKASGLNDFKSLNISNIERLKVVQPRELSRGPNTNFSGCLGIWLVCSIPLLLLIIGALWLFYDK